jgi:hypothetical protein
MTPPSSVTRTSPIFERTSSSARNPARSAVSTIARSRSAQSLRRRDSASAAIAASSWAAASPSIAFGNVLAILGRPINGIGLKPISSFVNRKVQIVFQVDQPPNRRRLMGFGVRGERRAHRMLSDVLWPKVADSVGLTDEEHGHRHEVLTVGLRGMR